MSIAPNQCTAFIQVWVDVNALAQGQTTGCYAVCNRSSQSTGEGTANLNATVVSGSNVCWQVLPIDPQYASDFSITAVSAQTGWAVPPAPVPGSPNLFTGQINTATVGGQINNLLEFSYNNGPAGVTVQLPVAISPVSASDSIK